MDENWNERVRKRNKLIALLVQWYGAYKTKRFFVSANDCDRYCVARHWNALSTILMGWHSAWAEHKHIFHYSGLLFSCFRGNFPSSLPYHYYLSSSRFQSKCFCYYLRLHFTIGLGTRLRAHLVFGNDSHRRNAVAQMVNQQKQRQRVTIIMNWELGPKIAHVIEACPIHFLCFVPKC